MSHPCPICYLVCQDMHALIGKHSWQRGLSARHLQRLRMGCTSWGAACFTAPSAAPAVRACCAAALWLPLPPSGGGEGGGLGLCATAAAALPTTQGWCRACR